MQACQACERKNPGGCADCANMQQDPVDIGHDVRGSQCRENSERLAKSESRSGCRFRGNRRISRRSSGMGLRPSRPLRTCRGMIISCGRCRDCSDPTTRASIGPAASPRILRRTAKHSTPRRSTVAKHSAVERSSRRSLACSPASADGVAEIRCVSCF
jgi:hypothetical protein